MKILPVDTRNSTAFGRKPVGKEMQIYTSSINEGLKLLNKQVDIIIHNSSAPSVPKENTGIGSLFSRTVQEKLIPFLREHGFTGIQQEPNNLRKPHDASPYSPESSAKNIFVIPLEKLTTEKYAKILPKSMFNDIVKNNPLKNEVDYDYVRQVYDDALKTSYENFRKCPDYQLKYEFFVFKQKNRKDLEKEAIYRILHDEYHAHWTEWKGIDKNLYSPKNEEEAKLAQDRILELKTSHPLDIDFFMFKQFLVDKENKESNKLAKETGIKIIGDSPVCSPNADEWIYQDLFMEGKALGCPPDAFSADGQRWGFKYFKPEEIFNKDGSLGKAGRILKKKYDAYFESFPGGLRIDHVIGLVDPFIYTVDSAKMTAENSGRIYSEGKYKKLNDEYSNIMEKIVLRSAKDHGMTKDNVICEDLGDENLPTQRVMKKLNLSGLTVTQWDHRGAIAPRDNTIMLGSHDNKSFLEFIDEDMFGKKDDRFYKKTDLLATDTAPQGITKKGLSEYTEELRNDKKKFLDASFVELFSSPAKRVQIFFADFWGLGKTYNRPGTMSGNNWSLRINENFEDDYYKAVQEGKAPNLAQTIAAALRHRGLDKHHVKLMHSLDKSAEILKEA
jgi:4-alpha-glucanotransferase